jgi:UDP-N-acetylglucosamine 2-epimerase (non-hydrolysing)
MNLGHLYKIQRYLLNNMRVLTLVGTRPEIIRLSRIIHILDGKVNHCLVHTGQNYDFELNEIFFEELGIRRPDYFLGMATATLGASLGKLFDGLETIIKDFRPDAAVILGDTNSALGSILFKRLGIPIFHLEAGNRSFDLNVPEEINRKIVDHISDFNLVYSENARLNLLQEGLESRRIYKIGSPLHEVLFFNNGKIVNSTVLKDLKISKDAYFLVSLHRQENVDDKLKLKHILNRISEIGERFNKKIVFSVHPRTRKRISQLNENDFKNILFLNPFGYFDYCSLQINAFCVLSDSGSISEESAILGFPALSIRDSMERPEAQDAGVLILTGTELTNLEMQIQFTRDCLHENFTTSVPDYSIANTSERVVKLILGNTGLSNLWSGRNTLEH